MQPLKHTAFINKSRLIILILITWAVALILGFSDFFSAFHIYKSNYDSFGYNYCEVVWFTYYREEYAVLAVAPICFTVMFYIYVKIYMKIRYHQRPGVNPFDKRGGIQKTTKALVTTLLNLGTFIVTWLPACFFQIGLLIKVHYNPMEVQANIGFYKEIGKYLFDLLMLNSIADSIIYTVRIKDVKIGLWRMFSCCCCKPPNPLSRGSSTRQSSLSSIRLLRSRQQTEST